MLYVYRTIATSAVSAALLLIATASIAGQLDSARPGGAPGGGGGGAGAPPAGPDYTHHLGGVSFDPLEILPDIPDEWEGIADEGDDLRLVQLDGPTRPGQLEALEAAGVRVLQYIHPYTYVVWTDALRLDAARGVEGVRWAGPFHPAYRVQPAYRDLDGGAVAARAMLYRGADLEAAVRAIVDLGAVETGRRVMDETFEVAGFTMPGDLFDDVARVPGVYTLKPVPTDGGLRGEMSDQINVGNYDGTNLAFPGYETWLTAVGVDGSGVIIANVDGGVQATHPDLVGRMISCSGTTCSTGDSGHGTHTAGIMAADGSSGTVDGFGFLRGLGVAPGANLVEQQYSPWFQNPGGMLLLMTDSYNNGASLSGNSWGPAGTPQGYDDDTRQVDVGVRDAVPGMAGNQPLTYVLSFMNGNGGTSSQGSPDEAKNLFNIGSTKMQTGGGAQILDIDDLSSNTAHGPALDGRTIPHMVAPGCSVDSTYTGSGYSLLCGTSMASPHVSGAVALFIEKYRQRPDYADDPSPALVKAAFLPVCHDLAGNLDADGGILGHPFDSKQGWGRMNLPAVVDPAPDSVRYLDAPVVFDATDEEWTINLSPLDPVQPVRMMLVWTDAPGHGLGGSTPAWVNDLDLVVETDAGTYLGNNFGPSGFSTTGGTPDGINNTEGVFIPANTVTNMNIRVVAANIAGDGVPDAGDGTDQDFALVVYNVAEQPGFALSAMPSTAAICTPAEAVYTINVTQILGYSDPVTLSASGHPAGTTVAFAPNPVTPGGSSTMTVGNTGAAAFGSYAIQVDGVAPMLNRSTTVGLDLSTAVPGEPTLIAPANGADDVSIVPTLSWTAVEQASDYELEISTTGSFTDIVYAATVTETSHTVASALATTTSHWWRVRATNVCGQGGESAAYSFVTQDVPAVLLVDDDDNSPNVQSTYTAVLDGLGVWYDMWDTNNTDNEPTAIDLAPYRMVIWFTGDEFGGAAGPGPAGEAALATWLDGGGCLLMSSQDYLYDRGLTSFIATYFGVRSYQSDVNQSTVTGTGSLFGSMGSFSLSYPFSNWSDRISPADEAELAFSGNAGDAAVNKDGGAYRTVFLGFPIEALPAAARTDVLAAFMSWCGGLVPDTCAADLTGPEGAPDGNVDALDFLMLIGQWGTPCSGPCQADITGPADNPDGNVDSLDFLLMIAQWGSPGNCATP